MQSLSGRQLPRVRAAKIANTARTPRDPRSMDRCKSVRIAEWGKDAAREKVEVKRVSLEWLAGELAGGREKSVSLERGVCHSSRCQES